MLRCRAGTALRCAGMSTRRDKMDRPRDYVLSRGKWPSGPFKKRQPDELMFYVEIVKRLDALCKGKEADEGKTIPMIAADANLSYQTLYNILNGVSWCELPTIFKLERVLNAPLWHEGHLSWPFYTPSSVDD